MVDHLVFIRKDTQQSCSVNKSSQLWNTMDRTTIPKLHTLFTLSRWGLAISRNERWHQRSQPQANAGTNWEALWRPGLPITVIRSYIHKWQLPGVTSLAEIHAPLTKRREGQGENQHQLTIDVMSPPKAYKIPQSIDQASEIPHSSSNNRNTTS